MKTSPAFLAGISDFYKPKGSKVNVNWMSRSQKNEWYRGRRYAQGQVA